jgi:hypothetical protein
MLLRFIALDGTSIQVAAGEVARVNLVRSLTDSCNSAQRVLMQMLAC